MAADAGEDRLPGIRACVFDAYGTLFDTSSAVRHCAGVPHDTAPRLSLLWREKQLQYTWLRSLQGRYVDFWQVTGDALDFSLDTLGIATDEIRNALMARYLELDAFSDAAPAVRRIKGAGLKTAILSNGTPHMLAAIIAQAGMADLFDDVLSVESVGAYKPDPRVYQLAADRLDMPPSEILFVSSNSWDAYAASAFGMQTAWCNRSRQARDRLPGMPDVMVSSLAELPALLAA